MKKIDFDKINSTDMEKMLLEMSKSSGYEKISINLRKETLEQTDEFVKIFNFMNRTLLIEGLIKVGLKPYIELLEKGSENILKNKETKNKEKIEDINKKIKDFKKKWKIK